uniref:Uncharacterized protein n=1 Tax=Arundo donax TaxID=35708 RepID=A0A0A9CMC9_ARUDO
MHRFFASPLPLAADPTVQSLSEAELALRWCPSTVTGVSSLAAARPRPTPHAAAITSPHSRSFSKGQAATPAWNAGRCAAATSPVAASSAAAAATEGENLAIFTSGCARRRRSTARALTAATCGGCHGGG